MKTLLILALLASAATAAPLSPTVTAAIGAGVAAARSPQALTPAPTLTPQIQLTPAPALPVAPRSIVVEPARPVVARPAERR